MRPAGTRSTDFRKYLEAEGLASDVAGYFRCKDRMKRLTPSGRTGQVVWATLAVHAHLAWPDLYAIY